MIKIIDTYSNGEFNPSKWVSEGYSGVIFKAGQGEWADVPRYHPEWWQQAKDAGLKRGWYWLVDSRHYSANHLDEMDKFNLFADLGELGLWADVEKPVISMTESDYWKTPYAGSANVVDFVYLIRQRGYKIGIYTGPGAFDLICGGASQTRKDYLAECELWTAQYPYNYVEGVSQPDLYGSWKTWTWWQWREGPDVNKFNGTDEEFAIKYGGTTPPPTGEPMNYKITVNADATGEPNIRQTGGMILGLDIGNFHKGQIGLGTEVMGSPTGAYYCLHVTSGADVAGWIYSRWNYAPTYATIVEDTVVPPPADGYFDATIVDNNGVTYSGRLTKQ